MSDVSAVIVVFSTGEAAVKDAEGHWYCDEEDGAGGPWVHPTSSHWAFNPDCHETRFESVTTALEFCRAKGMIP